MLMMLIILSSGVIFGAPCRFTPAECEWYQSCELSQVAVKSLRDTQNKLDLF